MAETTDAIEVLTKGPVRLFAGTLAVQLLQEARELERQALRQDPPNTDLLEDAIGLKRTHGRDGRVAGGGLLERGPAP